MIESQLEEFVCVVETGSVSAAARALGRPRASVSRRLARLEAHYGVQLLHREPHRQELTEAGRALYQRARTIVADLREARAAIATLDGVPRGLLRVGMPVASGVEMILAEAVLARHPEVRLEFVATHDHDDLISNNLDIALRAGTIDDDRLIGRRIASFRNLVYASPDLIAERGQPTLDALDGDIPCILGFDPQGRPTTTWPLWSGGAVPVSGTLRTNSMISRMEGAKRGLGLALISERLAWRAVDEGALVPVLHAQLGSVAHAALVWPATDFMPPKVRAFIDIAVEVFGRLVPANAPRC